MDDLVTWLRGVLDAEEDRARYVVRDRYRGGRSDSPWQVRPMEDDTARATLVADGIEYAGGDSDVIEYLAQHDPRSVLTRVEAEQAIVAKYQAVVAESERLPADAEPEDVTAARLALEAVLCWLAYGHRFDVPGWREEWKPKGV